MRGIWLLIFAFFLVDAVARNFGKFSTSSSDMFILNGKSQVATVFVAFACNFTDFAGVLDNDKKTDIMYVKLKAGQ